ncbi:MAG: ABC transporter substrate-binding protein [Cyanobacteria bacterium J06632_22]
MAGMLALGLGPSAAAQGTPLTRLTMQLDWLLTTQFAGLMVAEAKGLYQQQGITVALQPAAPDIEVVETVATQRDTLGCVEQAVLLAAQAAGVEVSAVATMLQASPLALISDASLALQTPQDLIGKHIGLHEDGLKALDLVLTQYGIEPTQVDRTLIPYTDQFEPLTSGRFDAIQCYALDEPLDYARQTGREPVLLKLSDFGFDAYAQVIFASNRLLAERPQAVQQFLTATFEGWRQALEAIPATATLIATQYKDSNVPDEAYQRETLKRLKPYVLAAPAHPGTISSARWWRAAQQLADCGLIQSVPQQGLWTEGWVW